MRKTGIIMILSALMFSGQACTDRDAVLYSRSLAKWKAEGPGSYSVIVDYSAFSPQQGRWELEVKNGRVVRASFNGVSDNSYIKFAKMFTVESIYKRAEAVKSGRTDGPLVTIAEFSETPPYIKSVKRINNERFKGNVMKDAGYSIILVEFKRGQ